MIESSGLFCICSIFTKRECSAGVGARSHCLIIYCVITCASIYTLFIDPTNKSVNLATPQLVAPRSYRGYALSCALCCGSFFAMPFFALPHCTLAIHTLRFVMPCLSCARAVAPRHVIPRYRVRLSCV